MAQRRPPTEGHGLDRDYLERLRQLTGDPNPAPSAYPVQDVPRTHHDGGAQHQPGYGPSDPPPRHPEHPPQTRPLPYDEAGSANPYAHADTPYAGPAGAGEGRAVYGHDGHEPARAPVGPDERGFAYDDDRHRHAAMAHDPRTAANYGSSQDAYYYPPGYRQPATAAPVRQPPPGLAPAFPTEMPTYDDGQQPVSPHSAPTGPPLRGGAPAEPDRGWGYEPSLSPSLSPHGFDGDVPRTEPPQFEPQLAAPLDTGTAAPGYDGNPGHDPGLGRDPGFTHGPTDHPAAVDYAGGQRFADPASVGLRGGTYDDVSLGHGTHGAQPHSDPAAYDLGHYGTGNGGFVDNGISHPHGGPDDAAYAIEPHDSAYEDDDDEYEYEDEEPSSRSGRIVAIAVGLILFAAVGGGLAYAYKTFVLGDTSGGGGSPVIRSADRPAKEAPKDPGGKRFANTDSKLLGRLDEKRGVRGNNALNSGDRVRPVSTLIVRRDGSLVQPKGQQAQRPSAATGQQAGGAQGSGAGVASPIPGMTIVGLNATTSRGAERPATRNQDQAATAPAIASGTTVQPSARSTRTVSIAPAQGLGAGSVANAGAATAAVQPARVVNIPLPPRNTYPRQAMPPQRAPVAAAATQQRRPAAAQSPTQRAAATTGGSSGQYVAVIASQGSRMDALKTFADMRAQYGDALASAIPEIQEADLSDRGLGTMYRVVVGPPGSRESATATCARLKSAGYNGCWIKAN